MIHQLLTESEEKITEWKEKLLDAFGVNGQVIIDVIPEVELIVGIQPAIQALPAAESGNRFNLVFKRFVNVFAKEKHPLAIFLDDLQWADTATLNLISNLMNAPETSYLFFIGAYRVNEVDSAHPLTLALDEIKKEGTVINEMSLSPLDRAETNRFIADTLRCGEEASQPLAKLVFDRTHGNPFFIKQLLRAIYEEGLLEFETSSGVWKWDIDKIQALQITDNVIEMMTGKIKNLPARTQWVLKLASCIGNEFTLTKLAMVYEKSKEETIVDLQEAVEQGLLMVKGNTFTYLRNPQHERDFPGFHDVPVSFKFVHDRIHQAAYLLIPEDHKKEIHFKIGKLLLKHAGREEDRIFDIVNHLNIATGFIKKPEDREQLARLNLVAGRKAKAATAYGPALKYTTAGLDLLPEDGWLTFYELTFDLHLEKAECEYLNIHYERAEALFDNILRCATTDLDKAKAYKTKMVLLTNMGKVEETVNIGIEALKLFGLEMPVRPNKIQLALELFKAKMQLGRRKISDLVYLPDMTDPYKLAVMEVLMALTPVAYLLNENFFVLVVLKIVNISLKHGNCYVSAFGYGVYGLLIGSGFGKYREGYEFGKLGLALNDRLNHIEVKSKCHFNFGWFINH